MKHGQR